MLYKKQNQKYFSYLQNILADKFVFQELFFLFPVVHLYFKTMDFCYAIYPVLSTRFSSFNEEKK